ncbi:MAG: hypothetical protein LBT78_02840 [Tannerella sp.]|jgi:hypothetical protein|nr:hypothetical protein [Tannerella sp.]
MNIFKEPLEIDFVVENRVLTKDEELAISEFIRKDKLKRNAAKHRMGGSQKQKERVPG